MSEKFQAVVIGGGPGGYVCAIRLAQLGLKTACIESRGSLGGTCLNIGCIPSKSLLNLSEEFHKVKGLANKGIEIGEVKLNLDKMMKSKDKAVTVLTKGVEFLLKKNKVTYFKGHGSFKSNNEISIKDDQKKETIIQTEKTVIATGSVPVSLPGIEIDEKIIVETLKETKEYFIKHFNSFKIRLGEYQKHTRGDIELPICGLEDMIAAMHTAPFKNGKVRSVSGESILCWFDTAKKR